MDFNWTDILGVAIVFYFLTADMSPQGKKQPLPCPLGHTQFVLKKRFIKLLPYSKYISVLKSSADLYLVRQMYDTDVWHSNCAVLPNVYCLFR